LQPIRSLDYTNKNPCGFKVVQDLGLFQFQAAFPMKNMNEIVQSIVQRSVSQRLAEGLK
jgi:hypothetical protein